MDQMTRGHRTVFANVLARQKGSVLPEDVSFEELERLLDGWIYIAYIDAGQVSEDHRCECGRPLRYQHIVQHKQTGEVRKFGITHLEQHMELDAKTVRAIKQGFDKIDLELDEVLQKIQSGWTLDQEMLPPFSHIELPGDIQKHLDLNLPLLDRQLERLRRLISQEMMKRSVIQKSPVEASWSASRTYLASQTFFDFQLLASESPENGTMELVLGNQFHQPVRDYLAEGIHSARVISELLIRDHGAKSNRYSTGKPKIYFSVCRFIEEALLSRGECELVSATSEDRVYRLK